MVNRLVGVSLIVVLSSPCGVWAKVFNSGFNDSTGTRLADDTAD